MHHVRIHQHAVDEFASSVEPVDHLRGSTQADELVRSASASSAVLSRGVGPRSAAAVAAVTAALQLAAGRRRQGVRAHDLHREHVDAPVRLVGPPFVRDVASSCCPDIAAAMVR